MNFNAAQMKQIQALISKQQNNPDGLVSFRAGRGKLKYEGGKKIIYSDKKRGKICLNKDENGILHFQWHDRVKKTKDLDLLVFPGDATFTGPLAECKDGQVFVLKIASGNRREFFWLQETTVEKDDEEGKKKEEKRLRQVRNLLAGKAIDFGDPDKKADEGDKKKEGETAAAAPAAAVPGAAAGGQDMAAFQAALLQALGQSQGANAAAAAQRQAQNQAIQERLQNGPDLADVLNGGAAGPLTEPDAVAELAQHLPEGMQDAQSIEEQLNSPQLRGTLSTLQRAVNGENGPIIFRQMGLTDANEQNQTDLIGTTNFLERIATRNPPQNTEGDNSEQKDEDKEMTDADKDAGKDKDEDAS